MDSWPEGIALVLLAVFLEAVVDEIRDRWKFVRRSDRDKDHRHSH